MQDRYLFRGKRIDNGEWTEGFLFMRRYAHNAEPFEAYIIQDAYEQLGVGVGKWNYGEHSVLISPLTIKEIDDGFGHYRVDLKTICQCTGIRDKTGKLIWENDILSGHIDNEFPEDETRKRVVWHKNGWCTNEPGCVDYETLDDFDSENFEVIGNMIDNPELLEV